jgi:anti-sigma factor RsiW
MSRACTNWRGEIGACVVGALDEGAAAVVTRHVAMCADCRAEYNDLIRVRGWLSRLAIEYKPAGYPWQPANPPGTVG